MIFYSVTFPYKRTLKFNLKNPHQKILKIKTTIRTSNKRDKNQKLKKKNKNSQYPYNHKVGHYHLLCKILFCLDPNLMFLEDSVHSYLFNHRKEWKPKEEIFYYYRSKGTTVLLIFIMSIFSLVPYTVSCPRV